MADQQSLLESGEAAAAYSLAPPTPEEASAADAEYRRHVLTLRRRLAVAAVGTVVLLVVGATISAGSPAQEPAKEAAQASEDSSHGTLTEAAIVPDSLVPSACNVQCHDMHDVSVGCRACRVGVNQERFCSFCAKLGLNDVGCRGCPTTSGGRYCNCPPEEVFYPCNKEQQERILNGTDCTYYRWHPMLEAAPQPAGGDKDAHGCIASAGYQWCEAMDSCIRPWEHNIGSPEEFAAKCSAKGAKAKKAGKKPGLFGSGKDAHDCIPSAGYQWCEAMSSCIRPWEQGFSTPDQFAAKCSAKKKEVKPVEGLKFIDGRASRQFGGDRDAHGCIPSAGYQWCEATSSCIRAWEHDMHSEHEFISKCAAQAVGASAAAAVPRRAPAATAEAADTASATGASPPFGGDADEHGCRLSAGYKWCDSMLTCLRPWEHGMKTHDDFTTRCAPRPRTKTCSCPPALVLWPCTEEQYHSIVSGATCEYYKHHKAPQELQQQQKPELLQPQGEQHHKQH